MLGHGMRPNEPPGTGPTRREIPGLAAGTALVGTLAGLPGPTRPAVSAEEPAGEPAIDTHIHVVHSGVPGVKPKPKEVEALYSGPVDKAEVLFKNENIWADLSGLVVGTAEDFRKLDEAARQPAADPSLASSVLKKAIGYVKGYKKFLYGSDWPLAPPASYCRLIETIIPKEHHREVFRTNAKYVFSL
jgi:hypothetical protein